LQAQAVTDAGRARPDRLAREALRPPVRPARNIAQVRADLLAAIARDLSRAAGESTGRAPGAAHHSEKLDPKLVTPDHREQRLSRSADPVYTAASKGTVRATSTGSEQCPAATSIRRVH
jgi:hypothetical protein